MKALNTDQPRVAFLGYRVRPYRIAWIVPSGAGDVLREVVACNCELWGGMFNPIFPLGSSGYSAAEVTRQLPLFDPDYIGNLSGVDNALPMVKIEALSLSGTANAIQVARQRGFARTLPLLRSMRRRSERLTVVNAGDDDLLVPVVFGRLSSEPEWQDVLRGLVDEYGDEYPTGEIFDARQHIVGISAEGLLPEVDVHSATDAILYIFDGSDHRSLCDFWNIRATGRTVIPLPLGQFERFAFAAAAAARMAVSVQPSPHPPLVGMSILHGRNVTEADYRSHLPWLSSLGAHISTQEIHNLTPPGGRPNGRWTTKMVSFDGEGIQLVPDPAMDDHGRAHLRSTTYVGELSLRTIGDRIFYFPWNTNSEIERRHGGPHWIRRTADGWLALAHQNVSYQVHIRGFSPIEALDETLKMHGLSLAGLSTGGLAVERVISHLGGLSHVGFLREPQVRELLRRLEGGATTLRADEILAILNRSKHGNAFVGDYEPHPQQSGSIGQIALDLLVERRVLRAGMNFTCRSCGREGWYHVSAFHERFVCQWCFSEQPSPRLDNLRWRYRSDGLFKLEGSLQGCAATILAMRFFLRAADAANGDRYFVLPSHNVDTAGAEKPLELDFSLLAMLFAGRGALVLGEAKSGNAVTERDIERMWSLAERTHAYIAFCTLAEAYSEDEINLFRLLRRRGARLILLRRTHLQLGQFSLFNYVKMCQGSRFDPIEGLSRATTEGVLDGGYEPLPFVPS